MNKLLKSALIAGAIAIAPLGKTHAQTQARSKQIVTTLSQNPYQTTIDSVAKANASFSREDIKIISQYADYIDNFQIEKAEELYAANPIIKSYLKLFPGGGKLRKDYLAIKNGGEEMKKKLDESKKLDQTVNNLDQSINSGKQTVNEKKKEDQEIKQTVNNLDQSINSGKQTVNNLDQINNILKQLGSDIEKIKQKTLSREEKIKEFSIIFDSYKKLNNEEINNFINQLESQLK